MVQLTDFFLPQVLTALRATDGWTGLAFTIPQPLVVFGILPANTPTPDTVTFTIPADADAGTYVASFKGRREFGGEALNRGATLDIKVGTSSPAPFGAATGCAIAAIRAPPIFQRCCTALATAVSASRAIPDLALSRITR